MPHLVVIQLMRVIKWPRLHSHGSCVNKKGRGYKGFYSTVIEWEKESYKKEKYCIVPFKIQNTYKIDLIGIATWMSPHEGS